MYFPLCGALKTGSSVAETVHECECSLKITWGSSNLENLPVLRWLLNCYSSERKCFPNEKCCSSEGKGILVVRNQGIPQSHTAQQISPKRLIRKTTEGLADSVGEKPETDLIELGER